MFCRFSALDLWSLATERTQEFGREKIGNLTFELRSLATEGTQEFPPLKFVRLLPKDARIQLQNFLLRALSIMNCEL